MTIPGTKIEVLASKHASLSVGQEGVVENEIEDGYAATFQIHGKPVTCWIEKHNCRVIESQQLTTTP